MISHTEMFSLRNRTALVTGATGHLGQQVAAVLAAFGAHVLVNSRTATLVQVLVDTLQHSGGFAEAAIFDATQPGAVAAEFAKHRGKPLHILVNCSYSGGSGSIATAKPEDYINSYQSAVVAAQNVFKAALPSLQLAAETDGDASVINIASMYGLVSPRISNYQDAQSANPPFYGAAKAALLQWTKYAACEFAANRIRVNAISPGPFPTQAAQTHNPLLMEKLKSSLPTGRIGEASEIRSAVMFLASPCSSFVTGSNVVVDGGWTSW